MVNQPLRSLRGSVLQWPHGYTHNSKTHLKSKLDGCIKEKNDADYDVKNYRIFVGKSYALLSFHRRYIENLFYDRDFAAQNCIKLYSSLGDFEKNKLE